MNIEIRGASALTLPLVMLVCAGCGTSRYNSLMNDRIDRLRREEPFTALTAPAEIPGTSVKIGLPKVLPRYATLDTPDSTSPNGKISAERVKISKLFNLPGVYCVYDGEGDLGDGNKAPMACQIAIIPKSAPEAAGLPVMLETLAKSAFPDQALAWEDVQADTISGDQKIPWKKVHFDGELLFDVYPADPSAPMQFKKLPAVAELWWHDGEHCHTLLFWRIPKTLEEKTNLMNQAKLSAGTISVGPPPAPAKPEGEAAADKPAA